MKNLSQCVHVMNFLQQKMQLTSWPPLPIWIKFKFFIHFYTYKYTRACARFITKAVNRVKGSVSRDLRWVLLNIYRKLSLRPIIALHKILILLKGKFTIYIKQAGAPLFCDMVLSRQCEAMIGHKRELLIEI